MLSGFMLFYLLFLVIANQITAWLAFHALLFKTQSLKHIRIHKPNQLINQQKFGTELKV